MAVLCTKLLTRWGCKAQPAVGAGYIDADHVPSRAGRHAQRDRSAHPQRSDGYVVDRDRRADGIARRERDSDRAACPEGRVSKARRAVVPALAEDHLPTWLRHRRRRLDRSAGEHRHGAVARDRPETVLGEPAPREPAEPSGEAAVEGDVPDAEAAQELLRAGPPLAAVEALEPQREPRSRLGSDRRVAARPFAPRRLVVVEVEAAEVDRGVEDRQLEQ